MKINKQKVITDSLFLTGGNLLLKLKAIIFMPFIINSVGLANYGAFIQIIVNATIIIPLSTLSLGMGFHRYTSQLEDREVGAISKDYWSVILASLLFSLIGVGIVLILAPLISEHILQGTSLSSIRLSALLVITGCLFVQNEKFIAARKHFKLSSIYRIFFGLVPYLGFVYGISIKSALFDGLVFYILGETIIVALFTLSIVKRLTWSALSFQRVKKFIQYSWALVFSRISGGLLSKVDRYFIGYFLGPAAIGVYSIVYSFCTLSNIFVGPFKKYFSVYLPVDWDNGRYEKVYEQLREGLLYFLIISFGTLAGMIFLLKPTVNLLLHKELPSIANFEWLVLVTGLGILFWGATSFFYQVLKYREQNHLQLAFQFIAVILNMGLNYVLVPKYGIIGAGIATCASYLVILMMCNYFLKMNFGLNFIFKIIGVGAAGSVCMLWFYLRGAASFHELIFNLIVGGAIYMIVIFLSQVVSFKQLKMRFT